MYIKEIELNNFKSFRGKTTLRFSKGLTIIYGPNGSGKSNVVDALLFVFGESSKKEMRGEIITDFIYKDPSIDFAKVSIKLDNSDKRLKEMPEEIIISRAVNRKGASSFRLNGKRVPRETIIDFLAQLRLEEKLNIIPQGKVIELIEMKQDDLAGLVKSIAGIEAFERKKEKAQEELNKYQENLEKVDLIKNQKVQELSSIEEEKKKADKYNDLKKQIEITNYKILKLTLDNLQRTYDEILAEKKNLEQEISVLKENEENNEKEVENIRKEIEESEKLREEKGGKELDRLNQRKLFLEEDLIRLETQKNNLEEKIKQMNQEIENISKELENYVKNEEEYRKELKQNKENNEILNKKLLELQEKYKTEREKRAKKESLENEIKELDEKIIKYNKLIENKTDIVTKNNRLKSVEIEISELNKSIEILQNKINSLSDSENQLKTKLNELKTKKHVIENEYKEAQSREEIYNSIKHINGIIGPVYKLFKIKEPTLTTAIVRAAGSRIGLIVVENENIAKEAINFLAKNKIGYASFLPLTKIVGLKIKQIKLDSGSLGKATDFIEYNPEIENVISFVFGDTQIFNDFNSALNSSTRAVTVDGIVIEKSGIIHGGFTHELQEKEKLLTAEQQIEQLSKSEEEIEENLKKLEDDLSETRAELTLNKERLQQLKNEETTLKNSLSEVKDLEEIDIAAIEKRREEAKKDLDAIGEINDEKLLNEINILNKELTEITAKIKNEEQQLETFIIPYKDNLEKRKRNLEKELEISKSELENINQKISVTQQELESVNTQFNELNTTLKDLNEKINILNKQYITLSANLDKVRKQLTYKNQDLSKIEYKLGEINAKIENIKQQILPIQFREEPTNENVSELKKKLEELNNSLNAIGKINELAAEKYDQIKKEIENIEKEENKLNEEKQKIENIIKEIDEKREETFLQTLKIINDSFNYLTKLLFNGAGELVPVSEDNKVDGGLRIRIEIPNKHITSISMLSGGEKSLVSLSLALSLSKVIDAPFFIFDEIDAALDSENISKVFSIIKQLSNDRQIIAISHNELSATYADALIGITMIKGESHSFSIEKTEELSKLTST